MIEQFTLPTDKLALDAGWKFIPEKGLKAIEWIETTFKIKFLMWQRRLLYTYFSWRNDEGKYRFNSIICFQPKKQGKTFLISALLGFKLFETRNSRNYSIAFNSNQAKLVCDNLIQFLRSNPKLRKQIDSRNGNVIAKCDQFRRDCFVKKTGSKYWALADNVNANDGISVTNGGILILDEIHRMKNSQVDCVEGAVVNSPDALKVIISTAGNGDTTSRAWERYREAKSILSGTRNDIRTLPIIYECDEILKTVDEIYDINRLISCNPILQECPDKLEQAKLELERCRMNRNDSWWKRFRLNQWIATDGESYILPETYDICEIPTRPDNLTTAFVGFDKGNTFDFSGVSFLFPMEDGITFEEHYAFIPEDCLPEKEERDERKFTKEIESGELILIPKDKPCDEFLYEWIKEKFASIKVEGFAADPYSCSYILERLKADGVNVTAVQQSNNALLTPVIEDYESRIRQKKILHCRNALFNWQLSNARKVVTAKDRAKIVKRNSNYKGNGGKGSIDNVDSLLNALAVLRVSEIQSASYGEMSITVA